MTHFVRPWFVSGIALALDLPLVLSLVACGDGGKQQNPDAAVEPDAAPDAPGEISFVRPTPFAVQLSAFGPDQLQSITAAPGGAFYAAGYASTTLTGPRLVTIVKLSPTGIDTAFGTAGLVITPLDFRGGADEVDIATQADGKILVSATVASATNDRDRDIAVVRLMPTGAFDKMFGTDGIATVNLNDAFDNGTALVGTDAARGLTSNASGVFVHAASRALGDATGGGPRQDTDFTVVKLTPTGAVDTAFGTGGQFRLDIEQSAATPRTIRALDDGKLLVGGYANTPGLGTTQPVIFKLTAEGQLDTSFAQGGVFHDTVLTLQTEVYNFAIHGDKFVTGGYGRNTGTTNDYISLRFDLATGARDMTWGGAASGAVVFDPSGTKLGSNCRGAFALPAGKTLLIGSTGPGNMPAQDAIFAVLDAGGKLDTRYGAGVHRFALGADGNDQFWGAAVSGDRIAVVGWKGGGAAPTETVNDDAWAVTFALR